MNGSSCSNKVVSLASARIERQRKTAKHAASTPSAGFAAAELLASIGMMVGPAR